MLFFSAINNAKFFNFIIFLKDVLWICLPDTSVKSRPRPKTNTSLIFIIYFTTQLHYIYYYYYLHLSFKRIRVSCSRYFNDWSAKKYLESHKCDAPWQFCNVTERRSLDAFFHQIKSFRRFRLAFGLGLQTFYLINFS